MAKQRDFNDFLSEIEPSSTTVAYMGAIVSTPSSRLSYLPSMER